ncbi:MAG: PAS domain-containing protein [Akkermansia muciniphila]
MKKDTIDKLIGRIDHIKEEDLQRFFVKLAEQQGFFQQVFEAIQEGLILLDNKGKILFVNKAALKLFDKERGQITPDDFCIFLGRDCSWTRSSRARPPSPGTRKSFTRNTDS